MSGGFGAWFPRGDGVAAEADPAERDADFEARWNVGGFTYLGGYSDFLLNAASNETAAEFVRHKIAATVHDPETAALARRLNNWLAPWRRPLTGAAR